MDLKSSPDTTLIAYAKSLHESIYSIECFGTQDLIALELITRELVTRGYVVKEKSNLEIFKGKKGH